jgi:hypothetical protein
MQKKKAEPSLTLPCEVILGLHGTLNSDHFYGNFKTAHEGFT